MRLEVVEMKLLSIKEIKHVSGCDASVTPEFFKNIVHSTTAFCICITVASIKVFLCQIKLDIGLVYSQFVGAYLWASSGIDGIPYHEMMG